MTLAERLPSLAREELLALRENARRLGSEAGTRQEEAAALLPLIEAELAQRAERQPAKAASPRAKPAARAKPASRAKPKAK